MNFHNIKTCDLLNGDGLRVTIWISGCSHHCKGCQNPTTWNPDSGEVFTAEKEKILLDHLSKEYIQGITFTGGDPLYPGNRDEIIALCHKIKKFYPEKDIWLYTGYTLVNNNDTWYISDEAGNIENFPFLPVIDILVDGPFRKEIREADIKHNADPMWTGSSNQRVIAVKETVQTGKITLHCT